MIIYSDEPITQDIQIGDEKYYWTHSYVDLETSPRFVSVFIAVQSSSEEVNKC